jgi:predicted DNA-binding protein (UPF0251 family)
MAQDINALNQEIADLRKQLRDTPLTPFEPKDLDKALLTVKALRQEFRESKSDLDYIAKSFKDTVNEMSRQNIYYNTAKKSINGIADISKQLVDYRRGETSLSEKQLKTLQNQARVKFEEIQLAIRSGQLDDKDLIAAQAALDEKIAFNAALNRTITLQAQVNKEVGLLGEGLEGAGKFLEKMGFAGIAKPISDAIQKTKEARLQMKLNQDAISDVGKEMEALNSRNLTNAQIRAGFGGKELKTLLAQKEALEDQNKELDKQTNKYKNIASAIKEQFTLTNMTDAILGKMVKSFNDLDEAQTKFKNLTGGQIPMMDQFNDRLITSVDYIKTASSLTEQLGMNAQAVFSDDTLAAASEMVKSMGMTQEQANKAAIMSQVNGKSVDDMNKSLKEGNKQYNQQNRSALAQGVIMREVYNTSTAIAASMGNSVDRIGDAVRQAKDLGLSLKDVEGIASSLLDIESSIAAEFEYEVISGKQLNLEAARYYALTNQTDKLTEEIAKNQSIIQSFASGNRIEQEAAAKAMGISRDQLSEMYMASLRKKGLDDEAISKAMAMDEMDVKRLTTQEAINTSIAKMTELLAGPAQFLTSMLDNAVVLYSVMGMIATVMAVNVATSIGKSAIALAGMIPKTATLLGLEVGRAAAAVASASALTLGLGALGIIAGIATVMAVVKSNTKPQTPTVPGLAEGGTVTREGSVLVGEEGPEILSMKPGATVTPLNKINAATISSPTIVNQPSPPVQQQQPKQQAIDYDRLEKIFNVNLDMDGVNFARLQQKAPLGIATRKI